MLGVPLSFRLLAAALLLRRPLSRSSDRANGGLGNVTLRGVIEWNEVRHVDWNYGDELQIRER